MSDRIRLNIRLLTGVSAALLREKSSRRKIMFYTSVLTMVVVFGGVLFLTPLLAKSPLLFLTYLLFCLGGALFMVLLALYDMAMIRRQHRSELMKLRNEVTAALAADSPAASARQDDDPADDDD